MKLKAKKSMIFIIFSMLVALIGVALILSLPKVIDNSEQANAADPTEEPVYWTDIYGDFDTYVLSGAGTEAFPYLIQSEKDLAFLSWTIYNNQAYNANVATNNDSVKYFYDGIYFKQTKDLNLAGYYWQPIGIYYDRAGNYNKSFFSGSYNGNGFKISGLTTPEGSTDAYSYQGLFGAMYVKSIVKIENITLDNVNIKGYSDVAGIVGYVSVAGDDINLTKCSVYGNVDGNSNVGGLVGSCNSAYPRSDNYNFHISDCENHAQITGTNYVGGIISIPSSYDYLTYTIDSCINYANLIGESYIGGISAYVSSNCKFTNCSNRGRLTSNSSNSSYVGGIIGYIISSSKNGIIENCNNIGEIVGLDYVGGISGFASGNYSIENCYNEGTISGRNYVGGIFGFSGDIKNCYNEGYVSGVNYVGGISGYGGNIISSYNAGQINAEELGGGIAGTIRNNSLSLCYNSGDIITTSGTIGGIVGEFELESSSSIYSLVNAYNTGTLQGGNQSIVGGIIGLIKFHRSEERLIIKNVYNKGFFNIAEDVLSAGGIIGEVDIGSSSILDVANTFNITNSFVSNFGAYIGKFDYTYTSGSGQISYTFNYNYFGGDGFTSDSKIVGDESLTITTGISYLKDIETLAKTENWFTNENLWQKNFIWDFDLIWGFNPVENDGYPIFGAGSSGGEKASYWIDLYNDFNTYTLEGQGTKTNPYLIQSEKDLTYLSYAVKEGKNSVVIDDYNVVFQNCYFLQTKDLNLEGYFWFPIGYSSSTSFNNISIFGGNYDGGGYSISGLQSSGDEVIFGLFGVVWGDNTRFQNITISDSKIINYQTNSYVSTIVGCYLGESITFLNCINYASVTNLGITGGIAGFTASTSTQARFINCINYGSIYGNMIGSGISCVGFDYFECVNYGDVEGGQIASGISYYSLGNIKYSENHGNVSGMMSAGIVGMATGIIENCQNYGKVKGRSANGICYMLQGGISYCSNFAEISGSSDYVAGIVGNVSASDKITIERCVNKGKIVASNSNAVSSNVTYVAGIVGAGSNFVCLDCYNYGEIISNLSNSYCAGLVGQLTNADIVFSYNKGSVTSSSNIGGIAGSVGSGCKILNTFNVGAINSDTSDESKNIGAIVSYNNGGTIDYSYFGGGCTQDLKAIGNQDSTSLNLTYIDNLESLVTQNSDWLTSPSNWCEYVTEMEEIKNNFDFNTIWEIDTDFENDGYPVLINYDEKNLMLADNRTNSFSGGDGTKENPYLISTIQEYGYFVYLIESGAAESVIVGDSNFSVVSYLPNQYFKQTGNLDFAGYYIKSIGYYPTNTYGFGGNYDGGGFYLDNLTILSAGGWNYFSGVFGVLAAPKGIQVSIKNLTIENINFLETPFYPSVFVGIAFCEEELKIENCVNNADLSNENSNSQVSSFLGMDGGYSTSKIISCVNNGNMTGNSASGIGSASEIYDCINNGTITALNIGSDNTNCKASGIGSANNISKCINNGNIISGYSSSGIGEAETIEKCVNNGFITAEVDASGISNYYNSYGSENYKILNCYNTGNITSTQNAGGLIGTSNSSSLAIYSSYNRGRIEGNNYAGGLVGYLNGTLNITNNFNIGEVVSNSLAGGIIGGISTSANLTYQYNYYGGDCSSSLYSIGGDNSKQNYLSEIAQLAKTEEWFVNVNDGSNDIWEIGQYIWDFAGVWGFKDGENDGYPVFADVSLWTDTGNRSSYLVGSGTQSDPYLISSAQDLAYLSYMVNSKQAPKIESSLKGLYGYYANDYFKQTCDIDLTEHYWKSIGNVMYNENGGLDGAFFAGNYDGDGYLISGLNTLNGTNFNYYTTGLFGSVITANNDVVIKNITIVNSNIKGNAFLGGIVGAALSFNNNNIIIDNCKNYATIESNNSMGVSVIGGIVGHGNSKISNCINYGNLINNTNSADSYTGGISGTNFNSIVDSKNYGNVIGNNCSGGIAGFLSVSENIELNNCYSSGEISALATNAGGLIGKVEVNENYTLDINYCLSESIFNTENNAGALIGETVGAGAVNISYCYSISKNQSAINTIGNQGITNFSIDKTVYLIMLNDGSILKRYIGNDFTDFSWINYSLTPVPKHMAWVGEIQTTPAEYNGVDDWVLQKMIDEGWVSVAI